MGRYLEKGAFFPGANNVGEYRIVEIIGKGSSCVVYFADFTDYEGNVTEHILKEYNPISLHTVRSSDSRLIVRENEREEFENGLLRFRTGYKRQLAIRRMCELKNSTVNIQTIFEANGTSYIDMTVFKGTVYSRLEEKSLYGLLKRMKALTQVIGSYHRAGFLHLDIKPDNIFAIPETCELVMLFDFDSVVEKEKMGPMGGLSYTKDWAAPEQLAVALRRRICEATDLYAVGEILFFKIFGRHALTEERRPFAEYDFDPEASFFQNVNPKAFPLLTDFLHHTISSSVKGRYQSADELLSSLDQIIKLTDPKEPYLMDSAVLPQTFFIGRDSELNRIHKLFEENEVVFLSGIGGIGKSELAKNYARIHRCDYDNVIFTIYNGNFQMLVNDDIRVPIANFSQYQGESEPDYFRRKLRKLKELCNHRVLFIIDNLDDAELGSEAQEYFKNILSMGCRFIITTRIREWSYAVYDIDAFSERLDLVRLFLEYCPVNDGEMPAVSEIIDYADGHTLTVELIARQTKAGFTTPTRMLAKLKKHGLAGSGKEKINSSKDNLHGKKTAFDHICAVFDIANLNEQERYILVNMALMPLDGVRGELFRDWCELEDFDAVNMLIEGGWLDRNDNLIKMHPVIGEAAVQRIDGAESLCEKLLRNVEETIENYEKEDKKGRLESDSAFLNSLAVHILKFDFSSELIADILGSIPDIIADKGYMKEAIKYGERAFGIRRKIFGDEHQDTACALINLGALYRDAGDLEKAEEYLLKAFGIQQRLCGDEHPDTIGALNNLGTVYHKAGDLEKAEEYLLKAYVTKQKLYGDEHPDTAGALNNLGILYLTAGDLKKAEEYLLKAHGIQQKLFGDEHPDTAGFLNNLGMFYRDAGDLEKAEEYFLKSYEVRQKLYGEVYHDVAISLDNLGKLYCDTGDLEKAEKYLLRAYEIQQKLYGDEYPNTADSLDHLGVLYYKVGDLKKAEEYLFKSYEIRQRLYGDGYHDVGISLNHLGFLHRDAGNLEKAKEYYLKSYEIRQKMYENEYFDAIGFLEQLGLLYINNNDMEKAEECYLEAYEILKKQQQRENDSSATADFLNKLGYFYEELGNLEKAKEYYLKSYETYKKLYGSNYSKVADLLTDLGILYCENDELEKAEASLLQAYESRKKLYQDAHPDIMDSLINLGIFYRSTKDLEKAEEYFLHAYTICQEMYGDAHSDAADLLKELGLIYRKKCDYKSAKKYYNKALSIYRKLYDENHPEIIALEEILSELNG